MCNWGRSTSGESNTSVAREYSKLNFPHRFKSKCWGSNPPSPPFNKHMKKQHIEEAIKHATANKSILKTSQLAGCYYCKAIYDAAGNVSCQPGCIAIGFRLGIG